MSKGVQAASLSTLLLLAGCAYYCPPPPSASLGVSHPFDTSAAFRKALEAGPGSKPLQDARIEYLLEQIAHSPYNLIRNDSRYSRKQARSHFLWKLSRKRGQVLTAEDFIERIASRSSISGHAYLLEFPDKSRQPLRTILLRELALFDQELTRRKSRPFKGP